MFKHQLSSRNVHSYQTTVVPRSNQQILSAAEQRAKFPWADDINPSVYQAGTDSSISENAYQVCIIFNANLTIKLSVAISFLEISDQLWIINLPKA